MYRIIRRFFIKQKIKRAIAQLEDDQFVIDGEFLLGLRKRGEAEALSAESDKVKWIGYTNAVNEIIRYANSNK
jgi:hypothetical protein